MKKLDPLKKLVSIFKPNRIPNQIIKDPNSSFAQVTTITRTSPFKDIYLHLMFSYEFRTNTRNNTSNDLIPIRIRITNTDSSVYDINLYTHNVSIKYYSLWQTTEPITITSRTPPFVRPYSNKDFIVDISKHHLIYPYLFDQIRVPNPGVFVVSFSDIVFDIDPLLNDKPKRVDLTYQYLNLLSILCTGRSINHAKVLNNHKQLLKSNDFNMTESLKASHWYRTSLSHDLYIKALNKGWSSTNYSGSVTFMRALALYQLLMTELINKDKLFSSELEEFKKPLSYGDIFVDFSVDTSRLISRSFQDTKPSHKDKEKWFILVTNDLLHDSDIYSSYMINTRAPSKVKISSELFLALSNIVFNNSDLMSEPVRMVDKGLPLVNLLQFFMPSLTASSV